MELEETPEIYRWQQCGTPAKQSCSRLGSHEKAKGISMPYQHISVNRDQQTIKTFTLILKGILDYPGAQTEFVISAWQEPRIAITCNFLASPLAPFPQLHYTLFVMGLQHYSTPLPILPGVPLHFEQTFFFMIFMTYSTRLQNQYHLGIEEVLHYCRSFSSYQIFRDDTALSPSTGLFFLGTKSLSAKT